MGSQGEMEEAPAGETSPDQTLAQLYKSSRPPVELVPGVSLSPIVNGAWLPKEAKAMLAENWVPTVPEPDESAEPPPPPPSFDPAAPEYTLMQKRLAKSAPLLKWNELTITIKELETGLEKEKDEKVKEEKTAALEAARAAMAETEAQLAELRASFAEDPTSLVPWMTTLFELADAGLTTFDVSGSFFPHTNLRSLFSSDNAASFYAGPEAVLGAFKRRYERERGPSKVQLLARLVPNMFQDGYAGPVYVASVVEKIRAAVYGAEAVEPLDLLQLYWWDVQEGDVLPTLKALQALTEDKLDVNEESGEVSIAEPKKVRAIGLVDFPHRAIISAIQAGVPVVSLSIPFSLADRSYQESLEVAKEYNIKVFARDGLMAGLMSEKYLGVPAPSTTGASDPDLDDVAAAMDLVNNYGGWEKLQGLLQTVKGIADKHGVRMQTVALRWQIDLGTFPTATMRWNKQQWNQFGYYSWQGATPGLDWQLFQVESFLDAEDMAALHALGNLA